jgi:hypothetical protein
MRPFWSFSVIESAHVTCPPGAEELDRCAIGMAAVTLSGVMTRIGNPIRCASAVSRRDGCGAAIGCV